MDGRSWLPCRLLPFDGSSTGKPVGPIPSQCTDAAWAPDGKWMYFTAMTGNGVHIWRQRFPVGTPEQVTFGAASEEGIHFAADGRSFVTSIGTSQSTLWVHDSRGDRQISHAIPLQPGRTLPLIPDKGLQSREAVAALRGARLISEQQHTFPGPNPSLYGFMKVSTQRNIYRVPVQ